jgi:hypothetical protein
VCLVSSEQGVLMQVFRSSFQRWLSPVLVVCALALVFVPGAGASHSFTDVPDGHPFHTEIGIFRDTNITAGKTCVPPGTPPTFCPNDPVERQAMAAFFDRALGLVVRPNEATLKGVPGSRVAILDDDLSFVGTQDGALELSYNNVQVLRLEPGQAGTPNLVGGASSNSVTPGVFGAAIAGGGMHLVADDGGFVGGGSDNHAGGINPATNDQPFATVSGGISNTAGGRAATVGGGDSNIASTGATVAGGEDNVANGDGAVIGGGSNNTASHQFSTIPGGVENVASGFRSFAAGTQAKADDQGAFLWADSQLADVFSPGLNTFSVRAGGGVWLGTTSAPAIPMGVFLNTSTGGHLTSGGAWTNASDRTQKEGFSAVDGQRLLRALAGIPIRSWSYKAEPGVRHLGPVAQDFYRAFRLGGDDRHISTIDAEGVALAAIQALHAENRTLERRLAALERRVARLLRARG